MGHVLTVHPGESLIENVVQLVLIQVGRDNPLALSDVTIFVPSPRLARSMHEAFVAALGAGMLLPHIKAFSFAEEEGEELLFEELETNPTGREVVGTLSRLMLLSRFVMALDKSLSFAQSLGSATTLASLFSKLTTYGLSKQDLLAALPGEMALHFERNLNFLDVALLAYPAWLEEKEAIDSAQLSKDVLLSQAEMFCTRPTAQLTIAAGFSDSTPAGVAALKGLISMENGYLILPGLDRAMAAEGFDNLSPTHPQYTMKEMLKKLEIDRRDVQVLGAEKVSPKAHLWRLALMGADVALPEELRSEIPPSALAGMTLIEAQNEQKEAEVIALIMRASLEEADKTCALVTSDRSLGRRVRAALRRYGVEVDDSAGEPLSLTPLGQFFKLSVQVLQGDFAPLSLSALLKHPLCRLSLPRSELKKRVEALEMLALRGERGTLGFDGLKIKLAAKAAAGATAEKIQRAEALCASVAEAYQLSEGAKSLDLDSKQPISVWISWHMGVLMRLAQGEVVAEHTIDEETVPDFLQTDAGDALLTLLESWQGAHNETGALTLKDYAEALDVLMAGASVRSKYNMHPRLFIWGPLEARMQQVDTVIIGGVNEGVWPRSLSADPWLNRALLQNLGLPPKETSLGMAAHDFVSLASMKNVFFTRAVRDAEGESVPSRFLARLEALLAEDAYNTLKNRGAIWLARLDEMSTPHSVHTSLKTSARVVVPVAARSKVWSASHVKDLMQCPYKAYAHKILGLSALDMYEQAPEASDKGSLIHEILESFFAPTTRGNFVYEGTWEKEDVLGHLRFIGKHVFADIEGQSVKALWWQKFEQIADAFSDKMIALRAQGRQVMGVEKKATKVLGHGITLHGRADRLDLTHNELVVLDYKTGTPPKPAQIMSGKEPQMAVLAYLAEEGAFGAIQGLAGLEYWVLKNGVEVKSALSKKMDMEGFLQQSKEGIEQLVGYFDDPQTAYEAIPATNSTQEKEGICKYCDYAGLCRYRHWSTQKNEEVAV